ncbi:MAG: hypothetical protein HQL31_02165 [Planctomycetes bacterium]|nr:hypothetical protein [Planctomycetota bacterium]
MRSLALLLPVLFAFTGVIFADVQMSRKLIKSNTDGIRFDADSNDTVDVIITASGNLGIGTLTPSANLHVEGNVYFLGNLNLADGINYRGSGKPKRSIILTAAGAIPPGNSNGCEQALEDGSFHSYYTLSFDDSTDEYAYWHWIQPDSYDGGNINATLYWYAGAGAGDAVWTLDTKGIADGEAIDAALGTVQSVTETTGAANIMNVTAFTAFSPGWVAGDYIIFKLARDADAVADDMVGDGKVIKIKIEYSVNTETD